MSPPAVEVEDLTWRYLGQDDPALEGVSVTVDNGGVLGIVGPNEHGKTTLLKAVSGMIPMSTDGIMEGRVALHGKPPEAYGERELASTVGFVFSDPELQFTMMNVMDEIVFGLENLGLDVDRIEERLYWAAEKVGIEDLLDKSPLELSGGQKQRVALASVIAMKPEVFVFDEPTNMLDPRGKAKVFEIIEELISEDKTVLIAEHDLEYLAPLADELVYLSEGEITKRARPHAFFAELSENELAGLFTPEVTVFVREAAELLGPVDELPLTIDEALSTWEAVVSREAE